ncbi:MAG: ribose 5-phosphate isomerase B [Elusimicrobia bacterium CG08_land_8_20_14_0_20_44_26]|nr:MAG: ribose 5-phosphate isomerase B [Elusimicrobia bacterium CG08_land_8_20_14_0_20_44_26]
MNIAIGSDHGGYKLKEHLKKYLQKNGHTVVDFGCYSEDSVDYPDIAFLVGEAMKDKKYDKAILIDGTGGGMTLAANKIKGIRAVCAYNEATGAFASEHDDANILCLGGKMLGELLAEKIVDAYIKTPFGGERHQRRLDKIAEIEKKYFK